MVPIDWGCEKDRRGGNPKGNKFGKKIKKKAERRREGEVEENKNQRRSRSRSRSRRSVLILLCGFQKSLAPEKRGSLWIQKGGGKNHMKITQMVAGGVWQRRAFYMY